MNKNEIIEFLEENGLNDVEEIAYKEEFIVFRAFYDFDEEELEAAKDYADNESSDEDRDKWREEYFLPFLSDISSDNIKEIMEDLTEKFDIDGQFVIYDVDNEERCEVIAVFSNEDFDIENVLEDLDIK